MTGGSSGPAATDTVARPVTSRWRLIAARALTVLAVLLAVVGVVADFVKREALDEAQFATPHER
jgi:hypothetical protein